MSSVSTEWRLPAPIHARSSIRVDADDLRHAVVSLLHSWWMPTPRCRRWLDNPFYRSYGVLTMCRMRYTLQTERGRVALCRPAARVPPFRRHLSSLGRLGNFLTGNRRSDNPSH